MNSYSSVPQGYRRWVFSLPPEPLAECCGHPVHRGPCMAVRSGERCPNFATCQGVLWHGCQCIVHAGSLACDGGCPERFQPCECDTCPQCGRAGECGCAL